MRVYIYFKTILFSNNLLFLRMFHNIYSIHYSMDVEFSNIFQLNKWLGATTSHKNTEIDFNIFFFCKIFRALVHLQHTALIYERIIFFIIAQIFHYKVLVGHSRVSLHTPTN